jgi:hypothetical protein
MFPITTNNLCINIPPPLHNLFLGHIGQTKNSLLCIEGFGDLSIEYYKVIEALTMPIVGYLITKKIEKKGQERMVRK